MAIPPISNNPLLKLFRTDQQGGDKNKETTNAASTPEDIVEISQAAQQRLDGIRPLSTDNPEQVKQVADETRDILAGTQVTLGRGGLSA